MKRRDFFKIGATACVLPITAIAEFKKPPRWSDSNFVKGAYVNKTQSVYKAEGFGLNVGNLVGNPEGHARLTIEDVPEGWRVLMDGVVNDKWLPLKIDRTFSTADEVDAYLDGVITPDNFALRDEK